MPTCADWINTTRRTIYGSDRQQLNVLPSGCSAFDSTVALQYQNDAVRGGAVISVGLEEMYVFAVDAAANTVTVFRGWQGSPVSAHPVGALVTVNPRFSDWEIFTALNDDLLDLSSPLNGLYQVRTEDLIAVSGRIGYDLPLTGFMSIINIQWRQPNTQSQEWTRVTDFEVAQDLPTDEFPSGAALFVNGAQPTAQQQIRVQYRAALTPLGNLIDDVEETTGIPATATDIPPIGAALRIMSGRPVARANYTTQGDTRRATEVSTGDVVQAPARLQQLRQQRVAAEAARLSQQWPARTRSRDLLGPSRL